MIVVDASAVVEIVLGTAVGRSLADRIAPATLGLHAPHLLDVEVAQVIRRYVLGGQVSEDRAQRAIEHLLALDVERHSHEPLLPRIWALRGNLTAYDAAYIALAEALAAPLLTLDQRLVSAAGHLVDTEVV